MLKIYSIFVRACACAGLLGLSLSAGAFQLKEHQRIMEQAFTELATCFPHLDSAFAKSALVEGDRAEDTNLLDKLLAFSHYYHPYKKLRMWRSDSSGRIDNLAPNLMQCRDRHAPWRFEELSEL